MIRDDYTAWDECPDVDNCELIQSFLELVDSMLKDIQHLKAETVKARYELSRSLIRNISGPLELIFFLIWIPRITITWRTRST
ncbi:hypothetical protein H6B07_13615 [Mediterraneibacter glycyrrhizinilyticus]|nr:hypothetical protein [Mediterraneibacter glycyrrhizinilyticus]MBM6803675.1 hypothetical protein [Mediterraneibacter glycyrrhizinilyticus]